MEELAIKGGKSNNFKSGKRKTIPSARDNFADYLLVKAMRKDIKKLYDSDRDVVFISNKQNQRFYAMSSYIYDIIRGTRYNGVISPFSKEVNLEIKNRLNKMYLEYIEDLESLFPFYDFSRAKKKIDKAVYKVRVASGETFESIAGSCFVDYPVITLHLDSQYNLSTLGNSVVRHEFTHFACNKPPRIKTKANTIPNFLNEGITQLTTIMVLQNKGAGSDVLEHAYKTYRLNYEFAYILNYLIGEEAMYSAYFSRNYALINSTICDMSKKYRPQGFTFDNIFFEHLTYDMIALHGFMYNENTRFPRKLAITDFAALYQFISYVYAVSEKQSNLNDRRIIQEHINNFINDVNLSLDAVYNVKNQNRTSR